MNFYPYVIFFACVFGYLEASVISSSNSPGGGQTPPFQGPYVTSNIKTLQFKGKSYYLGTIYKATFLHASSFCQMIHMQLVAIHSAEESDRLYKYVMETIGPGNNLWSSGSRLVDDRTWLWLTTGETMRYTNWVSTQPDNTGNNEKCIELAPENGGLYWNDIDCQTPRYFICERYDTDLPEPGTSTTFHDGDVLCPDTSTQVQPVTESEKKYRVSKVKATKEKASQTCKRYGMELVSIPDKKTNNIITKLISQHRNTDRFWTSGIKQTDDIWVWWNHEPLMYTNWSPTEPNNVLKTEYCINLYTTGEWNDIRCERELYFICESVTTNSNRCERQQVPTINFYIDNQGVVTNTSNVACSCSNEEGSGEVGDPFLEV